MNLYIYSVIKINKLIFEGNNIIVILKKRLTYTYIIADLERTSRQVAYICNRNTSIYF